MITDTHPPILIEADECERLLPLETAICDTAGTLLQQSHSDSAAINQHLNAIVLANELLWAHEGESPADECLHLCAEQLKAHHLYHLETLIS